MFPAMLNRHSEGTDAAKYFWASLAGLAEDMLIPPL